MADPILFDYWRSSASYRVRIALNLADIAYDAVSVDLVKAEQKAEDHLARNPQGFVPVLEIDGQSFTQSLAIIEYLDETRNLGILPAAPAERAHQRALAHVIAMDIHPICNLHVVGHVARLLPDQEDAKQDWMKHFITKGLRSFEALLGEFSQVPFCCGATPGLADICLVPQLYNAHRWGADLHGLSRIAAVEAACATHPAFAAAHPDAAKI